MRIYVAGALFSLAEQKFNQQLKENLLALQSDLDIILPQDEAVQFLGKPGFEDLIFASCKEEVAKADVILAILEGADVDSGTCIELGLAYAQNKKIIGVRTDFRASEIDGLNIMVRKVLDHYVCITNNASLADVSQQIIGFLL